MQKIDISQTDAPMQRPYAKLRGLLKEYDYTQADIARKLGCGIKKSVIASELKITQTALNHKIEVM